MAPKLYMALASNASRSVIFCAKALGVELDLIEVDLFNGAHMKPDFLKMNPQHTVPVLDDDGLIICDSHAIMPYLVSKYSKDNPLYPEDIKKRAIIDQRLHFNSATLFPPNRAIVLGIFSDKIKKITEEHSAPITSALDVLEIFLQDTKYVAGNNLTIADFSIWTTISHTVILIPLDEKKYPKITSWLKLMENTPYSEMNRKGVEIIRAGLLAKMSS